MKNAMWYLGFLSILSLLIFVRGDVGFLGFLGFIPYFNIYKISDERLEMIVGKGARNAFMYTMLFGSGALVYGYLTQKTELLLPAFALLFGGSLIVCIVSILYYDKVGK